MDSRQGTYHVWCIIFLGGLWPGLTMAEGDPGTGVFPPSIGTCTQPDFFVLNIHACPIETSAGQVPHCQFSAFRYDPNRTYRPATLEELIGSFRPNVPVCIFTHGGFVSWEFTLEESPHHYASIVHMGGNRPLHFIAISWPSDVSLFPCPPVQLSQLERRAYATGHGLAQFLAKIPPENPVCLLGHSYGALVTSVTLQALSQGVVTDPVSPETGCRRRIRAVFNAAAIDHHWLNPGEKLEHAIDRVECMLVFTNHADPAMQGYALNDPLLHQPLGQIGLTCIDRIKLGWQSKKVKEKDVTFIVGCGHFVVKYFSNSEVMRAKIPYIYFH